jgi:hypothetical protein
MKRAALAIMMVCAAAGAAQAQGKKKEMLPGQGIDWQGDWDAALKEATARNVPIHFALHKDN